MSIVLGIHGSAGAGKDSIADYLISKYGWGKKTAFSKNLKNMCKTIFKLTDEQVETQAGKKRPFEEPITLTKEHFSSILYWILRTHSNVKSSKEQVSKAASFVGSVLSNPRDVIQIVGTDICRELYPRYHIEILLAEVLSFDKDVVVTDIRFPNEADAIKALPNSKVIKVVRENLPDLAMNRNHSSETSMSGWNNFDDLIIIKKENDGIDFLYSEVDNFLERNNLCQKITL